jgi:hypothetical protein
MPLGYTRRREPDDEPNEPHRREPVDRLMDLHPLRDLMRSDDDFDLHRNVAPHAPIALMDDPIANCALLI